MFLELLRKEFIERKSQEKQSVLSLVLSSVFKMVFLACFIALECFIAITLDKKLVKYSAYGSFDFLVLFLFLMMMVSVVFTMVKARGVIFNREDSAVTLPLPIAPSTQVASKVVYLYIESVLFALFTSAPLLICYGATRHYIPYYYIFSCLYPLIISVFSIGISLLLAIVYQQIYRLIKKSDVAQFVSASLLVIALCYLYQFVLNLFLTALNDSSIGGVFSESFVKTLHTMRYYFLPVYSLLDSVIEKSNVKSDILITLGASFLSLIAGVALTSIIYFHEIRNENKEGNRKAKQEKKARLTTPFRALLKKEMDLLFREEANLFSYTSLLILCPFLTFAVISSLNSIIYDNLRFYASYFPELVSGINLTLILLFSGVINASASLAMTREGKALLIVKYLPISPLKQILAKILLPISFSLLSLSVTEIVLISTSIITLPVFLSSFFIGALLLLFNNIFGVYSDMHDKEGEERKVRLSLVNELVPLLLPFLLFALFFVFSVYVRLPGYALYLIACAFALVVLSPVCFGMKRRYRKAFERMEVSN